MKTLISKMNWLVLLVCVLASQVSFAQTIQEYRRQVGNIIYSLETLQNETIIKEIDRLDMMAGGALAPQIAAELAEHTLTGIELLRVLVADQSLPEAEREKLVDALRSSIGALTPTILMHHGDDKLNPELAKENKIVEFLKRFGREFVGTATDFFTFVPSARVIKAQQDLANAQAQLATAKAKGQNNIAEFEQFVEKYKAELAKVKVEDKTMRQWKPRERMIREYVGQEVIIKWQQAMKELGITSPEAIEYMVVRNDLVRNKPKSATDIGYAERALLIRQNRAQGYFGLLGAIGGVALIHTLIPIDYTGMIVGYDMVTPMITDIVAYSSLATVALLRAATGSFGAIPRLKRLIELVRNPNAVELSHLRLPLAARLLRVQKKVDAARAQLIGPNTASISARGPTPSLGERLSNLYSGVMSRFGRGGSAAAGMCGKMVTN